MKFLTSLIAPADAERIDDSLKRAGRIALSVLPALPIVLVLIGTIAPDVAYAGTSATFDELEAETDSAVFGPLGKTAIYVASLGGALFAAIKGAWLMAGLGIGVAGLLYGTNLVADSSTFSVLIG